jgi:VCBS repeat-containing protein
MHLTTLTATSHSITASYQGSTTFAGSTSAILTQVVQPGNGAPTAVGDGYSMDEDGTLAKNAAEGVLSNDSDPDSDPLTAIQISAPSHAQSFSLNADGSFSYTPDADFNGEDSFTYQASDATLTSSTVTVTITVTAVNDAPSFVSGGDVTVSAAGGPVSQAWATGSPGPADESGQTLTYSASVDLLGSLLFSVAPSIAPDGTLSFTPNGLTGNATVTVHVQDNGGTANGGVDTSGDQSFTITLN